jgi:hypothetical protein
MPPTSTLPSYYMGVRPPSDAQKKPNAPVAVPNGNGTSTIINPDGSVSIVPTQR